MRAVIETKDLREAKKVIEEITGKPAPRAKRDIAGQDFFLQPVDYATWRALADRGLSSEAWN